MRALTIGGRPVAVGGRVPSIRAWDDLADATHSWDLLDATLYGPRVQQVPDRAGDHPLRRFAGEFPYFGTATFEEAGQLPGPLYIASSARFNGRPAMISDSLGLETADLGGGLVFHIWSGLTPNVSPDETEGIGDPDEDSGIYFNAPDGYAQPYWLAVLGRCESPDDPDGNPATDPIGIWDATHGGKGTGPTIGGKIFGLGDRDWQFSNFGPGAVLISTDHPASVDETVLVFCHVNGASSFLEVNWRDSGGTLRTERATGTMLGWNYLEAFFGWLHGHSVSAAAIGLGVPSEAELDRMRTWASYWIPPARAEAEEP